MHKSEPHFWFWISSFANCLPANKMSLVNLNLPLLNTILFSLPSVYFSIRYSLNGFVKILPFLAKCVPLYTEQTGFWNRFSLIIEIELGNLSLSNEQFKKIVRNNEKMFN